MDHYWSLYRTDPQNGPPTRMMATAADFNAHFYPPRILKTMSTSLERALELAQDERVKARLKLVALEFDYLKSRAIVYHLYRAYRLAPSFETLALLEAKVKDFYGTRARIWPDGKPTRIKGVPSPFSGTATRLGRGAAKSAPFNWDFALLRERRVLPGVGMKRTQAKRVNPFTIDGRIDKLVWKGIPWETIGEISMGKAPSETLFKIAYDETDLYVAFKGGLTSPKVLDGLTPVGRDGVAWRQENMELVIDPLGTRRMYYHFIINPLPDSSLERRFGYFEAPDHPLYQKFEWDWRGEWEYRTHIVLEKKFWSAELRIPFETLGGKGARAGDTWTLNVGRNEYGPKSKRNKGGLIACYLWSPNIESKTFHDTGTFGELIFR